MRGGYFLSGNERQDYEAPGRRVSRAILQESPDASSTPGSLAQQLRERVARNLKKGGLWSEVLAIAVHAGDGMTWSAETAATTVLDGDWNFKPWCLHDRRVSDSMPVLARHVGLRAFMTLAVKQGLASPFFSWQSRQTIGLVIAAFMVGLLARVLGVTERVQSPAAGSSLLVVLSSLQVWLTAAASAALGIAAIVLHARVTSRTFEASVKSFIEKLPSLLSDPRFPEFVEDVALEMQQSLAPRCVVIDRYESVDETSRRIIERYLSAFASKHAASEVWVVFETVGSARFAAQTANHAFVSVWTQPLLTPQEREALIRSLGREVPVGLETVKAICKGVDAGSSQLVAFASQYRLRNPRTARYTLLDLLYVLSLTTGRVAMRLNPLISGLSDTSRMRSRVLSALLGVQQVSRRDLRKEIGELATAFPSAVRLTSDRTDFVLEMGAEVHLALEPHERELSLPNTALAHTFWALYWHDRLARHPFEAFWMDRLAWHVAEASPASLDDLPFQQELTARLFEIALFAATGCLRTGVFAKVSPLLQSANDFIAGSDRSAVPSQQRRLLRIAWEAYSILGDDAVLPIVTELTRLTPADADAAEPEEFVIFAESLNLAAPPRAAVRRDLVAIDASARSERVGIPDYAFVRGAWMAITAGSLGSTGRLTTFARTGAESQVLRRVQRAFERVSKPASSAISTVDIMTMSLGMWCIALRCARGPVQASAVALPVAADEAVTIAAFQEIETDASRRRQLVDAVELAESAALLGQQIQKPNPRLEADLARDVLTREMCAVALASALVAVRSSPEDLREEKSLLARLSGIAEVVAETLGSSLPRIGPESAVRDPELEHRIEALLRSCGMLWRKIGLPQLSAFAAIRRLAFHTLCGREDAGARRDSALDAVTGLCQNGDYSGVLASLEVAHHFASHVDELSAHYINRAAATAVHAEFGEGLRTELALMAVLAGGAYASGDLTPFIDVMVTSARDPFRRLLGSTPDRELPGLVLRLFQTSDRVTRPEVSRALWERIREATGRISDPDVRTQVDALQELWTLRDGIAAGNAPTTAALLEQWKPHEELWLYPWMLELLLKDRRSEPELREHAAQALDHDPRQDRYNTYLYLALTLAPESASVDARHRGVAVRYLERAAAAWSGQLPVDVNVRMYGTLVRHAGSESSPHLFEFMKWQRVKIERDHIRHLPDLVRRGEFFLLFKEYVDLMRAWGLAIDVEANELDARLSAAEAERRAAVQEWLRGSRPELVPLTHADGRPIVSCAFLCCGEYLLTPPLSSDAELEKARQVVNTIARKHLSELLEAIRSLRDVPLFIQQVFDRCSRQLEFTLPEDASEPSALQPTA